jgi:ABC-2 type transport system permease protein
MKTIYEFIIKELLQFKRDKKMRAVVFMAPILQLILLGYAANMDVDIVHTAIFDQDKTSTSREFIKNFEESGYFAIDYYTTSYEEATELIDMGKTIVVIVIPKDFEKNLNRRETTFGSDFI